MTMIEMDPANLSPWDLRVYIAEDRAGGWGPKHFDLDGERVACQVSGADPGEFYGLTANRGIWERWYAAGHGCQGCAEVLHS